MSQAAWGGGPLRGGGRAGLLRPRPLPVADSGLDHRRVGGSLVSDGF